MRRMVLFSVLVYALLLVGLATLNGALLALLLPLVIYIGVGLLYAPPQPRLEATRTISPDRTIPGEPVSVTLRITNRGRALEEVLIADETPSVMEVFEGDAVVLTTLAMGDTLEVQYRMRGPRGHYQFAPVRVIARDRLGLFERQARVDAPGQLMVLPALARLRKLDIRPRRTRVYSGQVPARRGGPGVEFFGVREYQPGDSSRWINARVSARHAHALYVNEFEQERTADVHLVLDARARSDVRWPGGSLFDHSITAAATLADVMLQQGNRVGLLVYGGTFLKWVVPGYGKLQRERILRALAGAEQGHHLVFEDLEHLPTNYFAPGSQLAVISPLLPGDLRMLVTLQRTGFPLLVVTPDPVGLEEQKLDRRREVALAARIAGLERRLLISNLRRTGARVFEWDVSTPFHLAAAVLARAPIGKPGT
ncbi:MAG: DUF58 domain-containing protein [Anaerolineales bacterium]